MKKLLVVGQTPPPYGGQAMMINILVNARFNDVSIIHIRMSFSDNFNEIGKSSLKKVTHLFYLIYKVWAARISNKRLILYYPPAGPNTIPIIRDLIFLSFTRFLFSKTIYHFRAAGISDFLRSKNLVFQRIAKIIYGKPALAIQLSQLNPADGAYFSARKIMYIPNGLEDDAGKYVSKEKNKDERINILFIGVLREDKGVSVLLEAVARLISEKIENISLVILGEFASDAYKNEVHNLVSELKIEKVVSFKGVQTGDEKSNFLSNADIFCFPTFFKSESFGNVLVEAMMFGLPIVATKWRGVPDIVTEDIGFLTDIKNADAVAEKLKMLINDNGLRRSMGSRAREEYLAKYQLATHLQAMENAILSI